MRSVRTAALLTGFPSDADLQAFIEALSDHVDIPVQATLRYAEESTSAAEQIAALQQQLSAEQDAKESERREREQAEQQVAELKVEASAAIDRRL